MKTFSLSHRGQTALEYLLLTAIVAMVVIGGFKFFLPRVHDSSEGYYNKITRVIMGENVQPINGGWCTVTCPAAGSCGASVMYRTCECPAPAFGGSFCPGGPDAAKITCAGVSACGSNCTPDKVNGEIVCFAPTPACGESQNGTDSCGNYCKKEGSKCP